MLNIVLNRIVYNYIFGEVVYILRASTWQVFDLRAVNDNEYFTSQEQIIFTLKFLTSFCLFLLGRSFIIMNFRISSIACNTHFQSLILPCAIEIHIMFILHHYYFICMYFQYNNILGLRGQFLFVHKKVPVNVKILVLVCLLCYVVYIYMC